MNRKVSTTLQLIRTRTSKSCFSISSANTARDGSQPALMAWCSGDVREQTAAAAESRTYSSSSVVDASSLHSGGSSSFSPVSEAPWSGLPALKPLVNPFRLQALRLVCRDSGTCQSQQMSNQPNAGNGCQSSPPEAVEVSKQQQQQQHQDNVSHQIDSEKSFQTDASTSEIDRSQCNVQRRNRSDCVEDATSDNITSRLGSETVYDECGATLASSRNCIQVKSVFQYSFLVPETLTNMRAFCHASDRRVEAIARACDSEILLDPQPIRLATTPVRMRRITIRAPDLRSLEKCCRMFDDTFPKFYASSGLAPGGRGVSKVYIDDNASSKPASPDDLTCSSFSEPSQQRP